MNKIVTWDIFAKQEQLTLSQLKQFKKYTAMLVEANEKFNITAILDESKIISHHFVDSLRLGDFYEINKNTVLCDVGTGGGFPGLPLKIKYPDIHLFLIEVNKKKASFLQSVIDELGLENCTVITSDWRTFIRETKHPINIFCARASLQPEQLLKMFKPACHYAGQTLVYWAAEYWKPMLREKSFIVQDHEYSIENKKRRLIFFKKP